jgi:hypothetical protein
MKKFKKKLKLKQQQPLCLFTMRRRVFPVSKDKTWVANKTGVAGIHCSIVVVVNNNFLLLSCI